MLRGRAGVVPKAVERIVHARRGEQCQGLRFRRRGSVGAVGDAVVHGRQVWKIKNLRQPLALGRAHAAFEVFVIRETEGQRDGVMACADLQGSVVILQEQAELLEVITCKEIGPGQGGLVAAGMRDEAIGGQRVRKPVVGGGKPHEWIASPHARGRGVTLFLRDVGMQGGTQMRYARVIDAPGLCQGSGRICERFWRNEGRQVDHEILSPSSKTFDQYS